MPQKFTQDVVADFPRDGRLNHDDDFSGRFAKKEKRIREELWVEL
jgi:hypothetical protein